MKISPARVEAFDVLMRIETDRAFTSVLLPIAESRLKPIDRPLCHELTLGTLRRQIHLDRVIDHYTKGKKLDVEVRIALRLALYQLFYLDRVPDHAAIAESVDLVKRAKKTSAAGFVNAVLRRATREPANLTFADDIDRLSVESSHPRWLIEKWIHDRGQDHAATIARSNNNIGSSAFRILKDIFDPETVPGVRKSQFVADCFVTDRIDERLLAAADEGLIYFQDEASQMVAQSVWIRGKVLDVCAAPGGKTGLIARRNMASKGFTTAGDLYTARVEMLRENCRRQGTSVSVVQYDAERALPFADGSFNSILVDAPCSGTGTIRHNPEIRYFLDPADFETLPKKQLSILTNASKLLTRGGVLTYSTCSLEPEENESVCRAFLVENGAFTVVRPDLDERFTTDGNYARTWSDRDEMDGFFVAVFRRE